MNTQQIKTGSWVIRDEGGWRTLSEKETDFVEKCEEDAKVMQGDKGITLVYQVTDGVFGSNFDGYEKEYVITLYSNGDIAHKYLNIFNGDKEGWYPVCRKMEREMLFLPSDGPAKVHTDPVQVTSTRQTPSDKADTSGVIHDTENHGGYPAYEEARAAEQQRLQAQPEKQQKKIPWGCDKPPRSPAQPATSGKRVIQDRYGNFLTYWGGETPEKSSPPPFKGVDGVHEEPEKLTEEQLSTMNVEQLSEISNRSFLEAEHIVSNLPDRREIFETLTRTRIALALEKEYHNSISDDLRKRIKEYKEQLEYHEEEVRVMSIEGERLTKECASKEERYEKEAKKAEGLTKCIETIAKVFKLKTESVDQAEPVIQAEPAGHPIMQAEVQEDPVEQPQPVEPEPVEPEPIEQPRPSAVSDQLKTDQDDPVVQEEQVEQPQPSVVSDQLKTDQDDPVVQEEQVEQPQPVEPEPVEPEPVEQPQTSAVSDQLKTDQNDSEAQEEPAEQPQPAEQAEPVQEQAPPHRNPDRPSGSKKQQKAPSTATPRRSERIKHREMLREGAQSAVAEQSAEPLPEGDSSGGAMPDTRKPK
jgi:hypothetical protein